MEFFTLLSNSNSSSNSGGGSGSGQFKGGGHKALPPSPKRGGTRRPASSTALPDESHFKRF
jgi:hypothetical protein